MTDYADRKNEKAPREEQLANADRRQMLKRMGKYAAYTSPVVVALLVGKNSTVATAAPAPVTP